jgi:cytoskeleton-associated protein 5
VTLLRSNTIIAKGPVEDLTPKMTKEEALAKAAEVLPASALANLEDKNWKQRVVGIEELSAAVASMSEDAISDASDAIIQQLEHKPGWKETNFQVLAGAFTLIGKVAIADPKFARSTAACVMAGKGYSAKIT